MLDSDPTEPSTPSTDSAEATSTPAARKRAPRKSAAKKAAPPAAEAGSAEAGAPAPRKRAAKKAAPAPAADAQGETAPSPRKRAAKKAAAPEEVLADAAVQPAASETATEPAKQSARTPRKRTAKKTAEPVAEAAGEKTDGAPAPGVLFMAPEAAAKPARRRPAKQGALAQAAEPEPAEVDLAEAEDAEDQTAEPEDIREAAVEQASGARRRRRRGRRGRGGGAKPAEGDETDTDEASAEAATAGAEAAESGEPAGDEQAEAGDESGDGSRRRRRRRRSSTPGSDEAGDTDDPPNTVTHVRESRPKGGSDDGVKGVKGSTRLEAKRQRRKDGHDTNRRRAPILTEAEFLARREAVDRVMAVRQNGDRTQIAVLEDDVLVEHYVTRASATSYVGNVYLGRVQNVLPSMEAAFIDIGKGRNGVLYAGEVNWDAAGLEGKSRAIEQALKSGDSVLVQVTKDPIGHKGARLTSQVSLPGRFLVYVPGGGMTGISRRLPDTERHRLKAILKKLVPDDAGVIVRTAAEGASEEDLTRDVERLTAQWAAIEKKSGQTKSAPALIHGEPDLAIRVVRDVFNEDFKSLVVQGEEAWSTVSEYLTAVAPDLAARSSKYTGNADLFHDLRVDEQLMKALDRKVWLPSGGSLVIDRTEAMTVVDVNTGKFVGAGGNLEQTVTRNNIEAAEEIVRQLRLRDVGGIIVIDFIDMVLESNRDLVLRRLTECLGRDRTKHQVAEVTSLGLVQMTRKRVGEGLLEAFSEPCEVCKGRGVILHSEPVDKSGSAPASNDEERPKSGKQRRTKAAKASPPVEPPATPEQRQAASAAIAAIHRAAALEKAADEAGSTVEDLPAETVARVLAESEAAADAVGPGDEPEVGQPAEPEVSRPAEPEVSRAGEPDGAQSAGPADSEPAEPSEQAAPARRRRRAAVRPAGPPTAGVSA